MLIPTRRVFSAGLVAVVMLSTVACTGSPEPPVVETPSVTPTPTVAPAGGTVWAWGANNSGELGDGSLAHHDCYREESSPVGDWDCSFNLVKVDLADVTAISSSGSTAYALTADGSVWAWGNNSYGQLGDGNSIHPNCEQDWFNSDCSPTPVRVAGLSDVIAISGGTGTGYALKADGTVWAWGNNDYGLLGDGLTHQTCGTQDCSPTPVQVTGLTGMTAISSGRYTAYALKSDGTVWAWGSNDFGQLGDGSLHQDCASGEEYYSDCSLTPVQVAGLTGVTAISSNSALKSDGTVWTWGYSYYGILGDGNKTHDDCSSNNTPVGGLPQDRDCSLTPVQVVGLSGVTAINLSDGITVATAVKSDGTVWAWGDNEAGQFGDGSRYDDNNPTHQCYWEGTDCSAVPVQVSISDVNDIAVGVFHTYALKRDGTVWTWGENRFGSFGDDPWVISSTPVQVVGLERIAAISTYYKTSYVLQRPEV